MKPTSIATFGLLLAHPEMMTQLRRSLFWVGSSVLVALLYYTTGVQYISRFQELPLSFALEARPWWPSLVEFFSNGPALLHFFLMRPFFPFGIFVIAGLSAWRTGDTRRNQFSILWVILFLQMIPIAAVSGNHAHGHEYYFLSLVPTFCFLFIRACMQARERFLLALLLTGLTVRLLELSLMDLRSLYRAPLPEWKAAKQCVHLVERHPEFPWKQGKVFRSSLENFPTLGLCFGEREASKVAPYGFFWSSEPLPEDCRAVESTDTLTLAECGKIIPPSRPPKVLIRSVAQCGRENFRKKLKITGMKSKVIKLGLGWLALVFFLSACGKSESPQVTTQGGSPPQVIPAQAPLPTVGAPTSYRSVGGKNYYAMNCTAVINTTDCSGTPSARRGAKCLSGSQLLTRWTESSAGAAGACSSDEQQDMVDCNDLCMASSGLGGLCLTRSIACFGERILSSFCSCGVFAGE